ncbi:PLP-dependent aminotransferase family protein [Aeromonas caviae]
MDRQLLIFSREEATPLYLQIYQRYCQAIASGALKEGDRVPSVRSLACELNLARGTIEMAYQMLIAEGYFISHGAAGTTVAPGLSRLTEESSPLPAPSALGSATGTTPIRNEMQPFQIGLPALDLFPRKTWVRLASRHLRNLEMTTPDPGGHLALRRAIASYLGISRGIHCQPEQVFITVGYRGALDLIVRTLFQPGDLGWFEDPGYFHARQFLEQSGLVLNPVAVDEQGMDVQQGERQAGKARFAVVTPTHQSPMGCALSLPRRLALLDWAERNQAWIIEDDYDSEFRYHGRPLPTLKSLDRHGKVLYTGTFSKSLYPGLRMAYLVVPEGQIQRFRDQVIHLPGAGNPVLQATVADFMEQGHFTRHLGKMRKAYAQRYGYLAQALALHLGDRIQVLPRAGGMHLLARLTGTMGDKELVAAAEAGGLALHPLSEWEIRPGAFRGVLMGFANFTAAEQANVAVARLAALWPVD